MQFIGRKNELTVLEKEYQRESGFVVIYGRRRVGKTTLIKEFIKDKLAFYFLATEETESQSKKHFTNIIARTIKQKALEKATFDDWLELFQLIAEYHPDEKKVLVIDEFSYLVKMNEAFPSILQNAWDEILKDHHVMLILCGSYLSMMHKYALSYDSPLYGRRTSQLHLRPLHFMEVYNEQENTFEEAVKLYSITGGVPKYMEFLDGHERLETQIENAILNNSGFLYEEPYFLLKSESLNSLNYFAILRAVAQGNHKIGKLASILGIESSKLMPYLQILIDIGFIKKETPVTEKNPEKSRKGLYFIADNYMRFWFRYVFPFKGELELGNTQIVFDVLEKDFVTQYVALSYEEICKDIFLELCRKREIDFVPSKIGSFWLNDIHRDLQIDVMAIDHEHKRLFIGECKFHKNSVEPSVYFDLKNKVQKQNIFSQDYQNYEVLYGCFSKSGFNDSLQKIAQSNEQLILIQEDHVLDTKANS